MNEENNNQQEQNQDQESNLAQQLQECQAQRDEWRDRFLRVAAEFENYKKRAEKEKVQWITGAQASLLSDLITIVDDFDRAFAPSLRLSGSSDSATLRQAQELTRPSAHPEEQRSCVSKDGGQATQSNEFVDQSRAGFELIYKALQKLLEKYGVTQMKMGEHFDPMLHEAIMQVEDATKSSGDIAQVLQKGYMFKGEVLRPAKVSVVK